MGVLMPEIFTKDKLLQYLSDGNCAYIKYSPASKTMIIVVHATNDRNDILYTFPISELNEITDYTNHIAPAFRKSNLTTEIEAYNNVNISPDKLDKLYCAAGLASEASEVNKILIRNFFFSKEIDIVDFVSESGDLSWYQCMLLWLFNLKIIDVLKTNIIKLGIRYPNKNIKLESRNDISEHDAIKNYLDDEH